MALHPISEGRETPGSSRTSRSPRSSRTYDSPLSTGSGAGMHNRQQHRFVASFSDPLFHPCTNDHPSSTYILPPPPSSYLFGTIASQPVSMFTSSYSRRSATPVATSYNFRRDPPPHLSETPLSVPIDFNLPPGVSTPLPNSRFPSAPPHYRTNPSFLPPAVTSAPLNSSLNPYISPHNVPLPRSTASEHSAYTPISLAETPSAYLKASLYAPSVPSPRPGNHQPVPSTPQHQHQQQQIPLPPLQTPFHHHHAPPGPSYPVAHVCSHTPKPPKPLAQPTITHIPILKTKQDFDAWEAGVIGSVRNLDLYGHLLDPRTPFTTWEDRPQPPPPWPANPTQEDVYAAPPVVAVFMYELWHYC
ncbi:hypothetical protein CPC08DRAFT_771189 [Agrocybe pediades]|nr:hypothetical protein CPC08DRAFT_771189 [Agrocybe pediades]